jgi:hypothetical protein
MLHAKRAEGFRELRAHGWRFSYRHGVRLREGRNRVGEPLLSRAQAPFMFGEQQRRVQFT